MARRDSRERISGLTYVDHVSMATDKDRCLYCNGFGDQVDHYPPIAQAKFFKHWPNGFRIRACQTCNWNLGDEVHNSLEERKEAALKNILTRRIPPRFETKGERQRYLRMEQVMFSIARRRPLQNADDLLDELMRGPNEPRERNSKD